MEIFWKKNTSNGFLWIFHLDDTEFLETIKNDMISVWNGHVIIHKLVWIENVCAWKWKHKEVSGINYNFEYIFKRRTV